MSFQSKYLKYKQKYVNLKKQLIDEKKEDGKYLSIYDEIYDKLENKVKINTKQYDATEYQNNTISRDGIILYMFLGGLPEDNMDLWNLHFSNISPEKVKIVVHTKENPTVTNSMFSSQNISVEFMKDDEHLRTVWGGLSLIHSALIMWQHGIIKYKVSNVVFLPHDAIPLYKFNDIQNILVKFKKSLFCYPFKDNISFTDVRDYVKNQDTINRHNFRQKRPTTNPFCSQWFIINNTDFKHYFHSSTLSDEKIPTYIKYSVPAIDNEDFLTLNKNLRFDKDFWYLKYLKQTKKEAIDRNLNKNYSSIPQFVGGNFDNDKDNDSNNINNNNNNNNINMNGGAYDENFFCKFFLVSNDNYIEESTTDYKKIIYDYIQLTNNIGDSVFYDNFNNNSLYKIKFNNKINPSEQYIINTYHNTYDESSLTSCPVSVYHTINTVDVTSKLLSVWLNGNKMNSQNTGYFIKINEIIKDILSTTETTNNKIYYFEIINKIYLLFKQLTTSTDANYISPSKDKFRISMRDHPLLFIVEPFGMCLCGYLLISILKLINIINGININDNMLIFKNNFNEIPDNIKYLFVWNEMIVDNYRKISKEPVKKYLLFPSNYKSLTKNIEYIENLIEISKQILDLPNIYKEYFVTLPNFSKNYLSQSLKNGSLFIRKIQIQKNIKIVDLPGNHLVTQLLKVQYNTFEKYLSKTFDNNPLDNILENYDYEITQTVTTNNVTSDNKQLIKSIIFADTIDNVFNDDKTLIDLISTPTPPNSVSFNHRGYFNHPANKSIVQKRDPLFDILEDFVNKNIITASVKIDILGFIINIFDVLLVQYNEKHPELEHPIVLVMKGGFLMYNLLLEVFESFPKKIANILLTKYNNTIYSYDLDFTLKIISHNMTQDIYNLHYNNCKKIMIYASFLINYFVSNNLQLSTNRIDLLFNLISNLLNNAESSEYRNMELIKVEIFNTTSFETTKVPTSNTKSLFNLTNGLIDTNVTNKQYLINAKLINDVLNKNTQLDKYKLGILYDDTYNWIPCNNTDTTVINTVLNMFIPIKVLFKNKLTGEFYLKYFKEAFVDISLESYVSYEHKLDMTFGKYNYLGNKLSFFGYDFVTLIRILEVILFDYCVEKKTLTLSNAKYQKRSKILSLLYSMDILLYSKTNKVSSAFILQNINDMIKYVDKIILTFDNIDILKKVKSLNLDLSKFTNYKINGLFKLTMDKITQIDTSQNFENFYYLLSILRETLFFIQKIINDNDLFERLTINDIYNADFIKYTNLK
jgi:hypothetical protein